MKFATLVLVLGMFLAASISSAFASSAVTTTITGVTAEDLEVRLTTAEEEITRLRSLADARQTTTTADPMVKLLWISARPEAVQAGSAAITVLLTAILVATTIYYAFAASRAVKETNRTGLAQHEPLFFAESLDLQMIEDMEDGDSNRNLYLHFSNDGLGSAHEVEVSATVRGYAATTSAFDRVRPGEVDTYPLTLCRTNSTDDPVYNPEEGDIATLTFRYRTVISHGKKTTMTVKFKWVVAAFIPFGGPEFRNSVFSTRLKI